jgi:hypothetical protein
VFVNGRELTQDEVELLASEGIPVAPGDWWLNSQGQYGAGDIVLGTLPIGGGTDGSGSGGQSVSIHVFHDPLAHLDSGDTHDSYRQVLCDGRLAVWTNGIGPLPIGQVTASDAHLRTCGFLTLLYASRHMQVGTDLDPPFSGRLQHLMLRHVLWVSRHLLCQPVVQVGTDLDPAECSM